MVKNGQLEVGVVGGGIAGLSAAIALKRSGHRVEVSNEFRPEMPRQIACHTLQGQRGANSRRERYSNELAFRMKRASHLLSRQMLKRCTTTGALISRPLVVLQHCKYVGAIPMVILSLNEPHSVPLFRIQVLTIEKIRHVDGVTGETTWQDSTKDMQERYGGALRFLRHGDLHAALLKHLDSTEGYPVKLNLVSEISGLDCEEGIIRKSDGTCVEKDLIVLANGLGVRTSVPMIPRCRSPLKV